MTKLNHADLPLTPQVDVTEHITGPKGEKVRLTSAILFGTIK